MYEIPPEGEFLFDFGQRLDWEEVWLELMVW